MPVNFKELEDSLYKAGDRNFDGSLKFAVGSKVPCEHKDWFVHTAADLWCMDPNISISEDFWKLSDDKKYFIKTYEAGDPVPHDRRWAVYPDENQTKLSISYKRDPLITMDISTLGIGSDSILSAQKSLLKLLSTKDGVSSILNSVDESVKSSFIGRYPELGE